MVASFETLGYTLIVKCERGSGMAVYSVQEIESRVAGVAKKHGLKAVYLFGSYVLVPSQNGAENDGLFCRIDGDYVALAGLSCRRAVESAPTVYFAQRMCYTL